MSCSSGGGVFVKLSKLFVKIHKWALVNMSMSCKISSTNGKSSPNYRQMKKAKESSHGSDCVHKRWRKKLLFFWVLCLIAALGGSIWFLLGSDNNSNKGVSEKTEKISESCGRKDQILNQYFNVSNVKLSAFATSSLESDQISSQESETSVIDGAEKKLCLYKHIAERAEHNDQCPVDQLVLEEKLGSSLVSQSTVSPSSPECQYRRENISWTSSEADSAIAQFNRICAHMGNGCWFFVVLIAVSCYFGFRSETPSLQHKSAEPQAQLQPVAQTRQLLLQQKQQPQQPPQSTPRVSGNWRRKALKVFTICGLLGSVYTFWTMNSQNLVWRVETLANMCDERARMLQDQFNVSMNHVQAFAILVATFHHGKNPSAIDQKTFSQYTERTAFERPLTSGVAYALRVLHSDRERFEKEQGWTIKKMESEDQTLVQDFVPENLDPAPIKDEYAPVIFSQETVSHIISIDMMSGKEDRENIVRARETGKGVLTSPFKLLKSNHLGVVLTFAVYNTSLLPDATREQRINATVGYLGASYDVPSLVEKLLHQLASKQTIVVNVYDTTNASAPINMYGGEITNTGLLHISSLDFGDPARKHEMHCRFKQKPPLPWTAIGSSMGVLVITLLLRHIFHAAINRIDRVENDYLEVMELKARAEAADVAKSQFLATVSHEIRTPMNGVLGMLQMLMDTDLDAKQLDFARTAHESGKDLISLINDVLDQAKIESGRLEPESVSFNLHSVLDNVVSLFSSKSNEKGIELAVYVSERVPEVLIGDPGRFRQIITNLVGNSIKFTQDKGHIFVSVHLADEARSKFDVKDKILRQGLHTVQDTSTNTLSGFPVVDRWKSWENFKMLNNCTGDTEEELPDMIKLLVTVEDTGVGIPKDAQSRIFTPFMQADSSTSRTYGGTGIGLSISRCLVELMGGEIGFVSKQGIGSIFSFTVSFSKGETSLVDAKWEHLDIDITEFQGLRALVVDNRSVRAEVTRYHLRRLGIKVVAVTSMESACSYVSNTSRTSEMATLAMILIDGEAWSKEMGYAFQHMLEQVMQKTKSEVSITLPKIILMVTSMDPMEQSELKLCGIIDDVLTKPLRLNGLAGCFQEALGSGKRRQNRRKPATLGNLLKGKRILVVDDNMVNRRVAEGALKKYGAVVTCVDSGKGAIKMLKPPHDFNACFMDLQMPEMDGFEATRRVRSMENELNQKIELGEASSELFASSELLTSAPRWHMPILAMTADVIQATNEECMKCGMDGYVSKPFEEEQLYSAVVKFF